jgi:hypothetical protein
MGHIEPNSDKNASPVDDLKKLRPEGTTTRDHWRNRG